MKKVIGWILIVIPSLNYIGWIVSSSKDLEIPISPGTNIILVMMAGIGITLLSSSSNKNAKELPPEEMVKKSD